MHRSLNLAILITTLSKFGGTPRMRTECRNLDSVRQVFVLSKAATKVARKPIIIFRKEAAQFKLSDVADVCPRA